MPLNFPTTPTNGQTYTDPTTGNIYTYVSAYNYWEFTGANVLDITGGGTGQNTATAAANALDGYLELNPPPNIYAIGSSNARNIVLVNYAGYTPLINLPDVTTLNEGWTITIFNNSNNTANIVTSSNAVFGSTLAANTYAKIICIANVSNTGAAANSWIMEHSGATARTGTGSLVLSNDPLFTRAAFGVNATFVAGADSQGSSNTSAQNYNYVITTAANPSGVTLGGTAGTGSIGGRWTTIMNRGTNPINVYPPTNGYINNQAINTPISLPIGKTIQFHQANATHIYTTTSWLIDDASNAWAQANTANITADRAFGQANLAYATANGAQTWSVAAFSQANLAFARANTANITADVAFGQANLAFARANTANITADAAFNQANLAFAEANTYIIPSGGKTSVTALTLSATQQSLGTTLTGQTLATGQVYRITVFGTLAAISSTNVRQFRLTPFWGATALSTLTSGTILASTAQTTAWQAQFTLTASSATAIWTTGILFTSVTNSAARQEATNVTPASTTALTSASTLDIRAISSGTATADVLNIHSVIIERLI